nr:DUF551 domain-containing protein [Raoultella ornithinolytica]
MLQHQPQNAQQNIPENIPGGLVEAVNNLLNNDGSRGCYDAMECGTAREKIELWLAQRQRWEEQRKANLSAGNSPVIPDGYVMVPKEPTESMINTWLSEVANWRGHVAGYKAMPAAAPQPQNAPQNIPEIIPGWIQVSERMPEDRISVILWDAEIGEVTSGHYSHKTQTFYHCGDAIENEITHWMPPPCAPQEVKGEHQIRDEMDMGARITSHRFKV